MKELTLNSLFFPTVSDDAAGATTESVLGQADRVFVALKGELGQHLPKFSQKALAEEIITKIGEALDVGLDELFASGWKKYEEIQVYADPALHPPEETILVPLADHTVQSSHNPRVELRIKDMLIGSISLDVQLALALEGVVLKIQAGRIREIRAGSGRAAGKLEIVLTSKVGEKSLLSLDKETPKFELQGFDLGDGVAIPRPTATGEA